MASLSGALGGAGAGAATGASAGPLGAVAGGAIGGIAGLFGGSKSKEEKELLRRQKEESEFALAESKKALAPVMKYQKGILSGDRAEMLGAVEPEVRGILGQYDQARKAVSEFGPRGGGRTRQLSELPFQKITAVQDVLAKARPEAAKALSGIFQTLQETGTQGLFGALRGEQASQAQSFERGQALGASVGELLNSLVFKKPPEEREESGGNGGGGTRRRGTQPGFTRKEYGGGPRIPAMAMAA